MPNPLPLDAAARDELARKAEAARDTMAYAACRVLDGEMDHEANAIASRAQGEFLHAVSSPAVILALLAAVERGAELAEGVRHAERERAILGVHHTRLPEMAERFDAAARAHPPIQETDA